MSILNYILNILKIFIYETFMYILLKFTNIMIFLICDVFYIYIYCNYNFLINKYIFSICAVGSLDF